MDIKTKVATSMNEISLLHKALSDAYSGLGGMLGEAITTTVAIPTVDVALAAAIEQVAPLTPVAPVIVPNAPIAPIAPSTPMVAPIAPVAPLTEPLTPQIATDSKVLDSEGYYWDARIHASTKKFVKSKLVKGGDMWRLVQKSDPVVVETVRAEQKAQGFGVIGSPVAPVAPVAPLAPVSTVDFQAIKSEGIAVINKLVNDFTVDYDDVLDALREQFKIKDYEDLLDTQFQDVLDFLSGLLNQYNAIHELVLQMRQWGGDANAAGIDTNMIGIYGTAHSETLGGVHHSSLPEILVAVTAYHATWVTAGFGA